MAKRGYVILEFDLPAEVDGTIFPAILQDTKDAIGTSIDRVTRVHAAIGDDGLRESVEYLTEPS